MSLINSPFNDKVHSFFVPTDEEMDQIRTLLIDPIAESAKLDAQIADMEAALSALKSQRDALNDDIATHRSLLAPIRRIPQHALEEIFLACLPTSHNAVIDPSEAPLLLGRICRYWRELAYNTPTLWNTIHISALDNSRVDAYYSGPFGQRSIPPVPGDSRTTFLDVITRWMARSRASPLSISFTESTNPSNFYQDPSAALATVSTSDVVLPLVQAACERIHALQISADLAPWQTMLALDSRALPALRHCALFDWGTKNFLLDNCAILAHPELQGRRSLIQLLHLPSLNNLRIGNTFLFDHDPPMHADKGVGPGLRVCLMTPLTESVVRRNILREIPRLTSLHVDLTVPSPPPTPPAEAPASNLFTMLDNEHLCPELRSLTIKASTLDVGSTGLVPFVASRLALGTLKSLRLWTVVASTGRFDVEEDLRKLEAKGLEVKLEYPDAPAPAKWKYNPRAGIAF
ncbi:F-box domain-containing protein [Mycena kentingensis (nom. inval.)]|nr:F-box domain-containing protein [Mycena kentingensis (nom. inval.)]